MHHFGVSNNEAKQQRVEFQTLLMLKVSAHALSESLAREDSSQNNWPKIELATTTLIRLGCEAI